MAARVDRRVFVGTVAAGLPLLAMGAASATAVAQSARAGATESALRTDPVLAHMTREFRRIEKVFADGTFRADDYGALASNFRLAAAHARAHDVDALVRTTAQRTVARAGRGEVLNRARAHAHENPTPAALEKALDRLLRGGMPEQLDEMAKTLDGMHVQMRKRLATTDGPSTMRIQQSFEELVRCEILRAACVDWQNQTTIACGIAAIPAIGLPMVPLCAAMGASAAAYCGAAAYYGCF